MSTLNPKDKAAELIDKYRTYIGISDKYSYNLPSEEIYLAKKCAKEAVNEIMKCTKYEQERFINDRFSENYWQQVLIEIENY